MEENQVRISLRQAFTLVELLVVITIIGTLIGLLLPAIQAAREAARNSQCRNNIRQIGLALQNFQSGKRHFPAGYEATMPYVDGQTDTSAGWGWATAILPFIEEQSAAKRVNLVAPIQDANNAAPVGTMISLYRCPSDLIPERAFAVPDGAGNPIATAAPSSYAACCGGDESATTDKSGTGVFFRNSKTTIALITDGTSKTILVGERSWGNANGIWAGAIVNAVCKRGAQNPCPGAAAGTAPAPNLVLAHCHLNNATSDMDGALDDFSSRHSDGSNFVFADGSVRFLQSVPVDLPSGQYTADGLIFQALGTRAGGEPIPAAWMQ